MCAFEVKEQKGEGRFLSSTQRLLTLQKGEKKRFWHCSSKIAHIRGTVRRKDSLLLEKRSVNICFYSCFRELIEFGMESKSEETLAESISLSVFLFWLFRFQILLPFCFRSSSIIIPFRIAFNYYAKGAHTSAVKRTPALA